MLTVLEMLCMCRTVQRSCANRHELTQIQIQSVRSIQNLKQQLLAIKHMGCICLELAGETEELLACTMCTWIV